MTVLSIHSIQSDYYIEKQCVAADYFITSNGTATLEFAKEIMKYFKVKPKEEIEQWYSFNKNGFYAN